MENTWASWADYVLSCMRFLQDDAELAIPVKNQIQGLIPELSLMTTILRWEGTEDHLSDFFARFHDVLYDAGTQLASVCDDSTVADLDGKVSDVLEKLKPAMPGLEEIYTFASKLSRSRDSRVDMVIGEFFDNLSTNLEDYVKYKGELVVPVKRNVDIGLGKALRFFRNFLSFAAKRSVGPHNFNCVFIDVQELADAVSLSQLCTINEIEENIVVEPHPSDSQRKIRSIKPETVLYCLEFLTDWRRLNFTRADIHVMTEVIVDLLDLLLDNWMQKSNHDDRLMVPVKALTVTLQGDLEFLRVLIPHLLKGNTKLRKKLNHPLEQIVDVALQAGFIIHKLCELPIIEMKEDAIGKTKNALSDLLEKIKKVKTLIGEAYQDKVPKSSASNISRTNGSGFVSSLMKDLEKLLNHCKASSSYLKHQIAPVINELVSLRTFLEDVAQLRREHEKLKDLGRRILDVAYKVKYVIKLFEHGDYPLAYCMLLFPDVMEGIKLVKIEVAEIYDKKMYDIGVDGASLKDVVVGFEDEAERVIERLISGLSQLDIFSIIGMAGSGKTTLAKKLFNHPRIRQHFYVHAWCCVSQTYQKRDMLLDILRDVTEITNEMHKMNEQELSASLWKCLKGQRYLIVMDDLWDIQAWDYLSRCFPNDKNQSRIVITTRHQKVASIAKLRSNILPLRPFSDDESWELLQEKLFLKKRCPQGLVEVGKQIAESCRGLPLAVVLVAGLIGRMRKKDQWKQIAESLSTYLVGDGDRQCMGIIEMSYKNLPDHLKPCLLYFGAFPEDREILVQRLVHLWIAEGYIMENDSRSIEDEAEAYLMELIDRCLVIDAKRKAKGSGVKACRVHDLLRVFCLAKAKEENHLQLIQGYDELSTSSQLLNCELPRLSIYSTRDDFATWRPPSSKVQALLLFASSLYWDPTAYYDVSHVAQSFKLLRVLDLACLAIDDSFCGIELLIHLRYLAIQLGINSIPRSISKLENLQTFRVKGKRGEVVLPNTIWKMVRLRHMHIHDRTSLRWRNTRLEESLLENLITLSTPSLSYGKNAKQVMRRSPNLRKLKCIFLESWDSHKNCNQFPVLDFLSELESLKVFYHGKVLFPCKFSFPSNLIKLTLSKFCLPWSELSTIGELLPNLEVLKLLFISFEGETWETRDGHFANLKFLKLDSLDIAQWDTDSDHFPSLQRLVLQRCKKLKEIPSSLGDINTLETIEVQWCSQSAAISARAILKEQQDMGNEELKVLIHPPELHIASSS